MSTVPTAETANAPADTPERVVRTAETGEWTRQNVLAYATISGILKQRRIRQLGRLNEAINDVSVGVFGDNQTEGIWASDDAAAELEAAVDDANAVLNYREYRGMDLALETVRAGEYGEAATLFQIITTSELEIREENMIDAGSDHLPDDSPKIELPVTLQELSPVRCLAKFMTLQEEFYASSDRAPAQITQAS